MIKKEHIIHEKPSRLPTHPGVLLREDVLPALGLSITAAARELGVTRQTLHRIANGSQAITPAMALRLGRFCNNSPLMWLRMQQAYDLKKAELELKDVLKEIPVHQTGAQYP